MLQVAFPYESRIEIAKAKIYSNPRYIYSSFSSYINVGGPNLKDHWTHETYVSVDKDDNLLGYLSFGIDRDTRNAHAIYIVNFIKNPVFNIDLISFLRKLKKYRMITFSVVVGSPHEKNYDKICQMLGGRVLCIKKKSIRLLDGKLYDEKQYEIENKDYND